MQVADFTLQDLNSGFIVALRIEAKDGDADAVASILGGLVSPTMAEPAVKLLLPYGSPSDPAQFFILEIYKNHDAWDAQQQTKHFKRAIADLVPCTAKRERVSFVPYVSG